MAANQVTPQIAGVDSSQQGQPQPQPGDAFGVPKYGTTRRFVLDMDNQEVNVTPLAGSQRPVPFTRLDQLDIVEGWLWSYQYGGTWTNTGSGLVTSPFFPANIVQSITWKLQAAYNTFNLTGPLAAIKQRFRPMFGNRRVNAAGDGFCRNLGTATPTFGSAYNGAFNLEIPAAIKFDEYWDLDQGGNPMRRVYDAIVTPYRMAAQARVVTPNIMINPQLATGSLLDSPVSRPGSDTTSTYTTTGIASQTNRWAWFSASSELANPPMFPWLYTNDYIEQPCGSQGSVNVLIQNTNVSVGQVMSLYFFVWDPTLNSGLGGVVPYSNISSIELVTGGTLQNRYYTPQQLVHEMINKYGPSVVTNPFMGNVTTTGDLPNGTMIIDFALDETGSYLSNTDVINTYLLNGVAINLDFVSPVGAGSTVFMGVEALKLATS